MSQKRKRDAKGDAKRDAKALLKVYNEAHDIMELAAGHVNELYSWMRDIKEEQRKKLRNEEDKEEERGKGKEGEIADKDDKALSPLGSKADLETQPSREIQESSGARNGIKVGKGTTIESLPLKELQRRLTLEECRDLDKLITLAYEALCQRVLWSNKLNDLHEEYLKPDSSEPKVTVEEALGFNKK